MRHLNQFCDKIVRYRACIVGMAYVIWGFANSCSAKFQLMDMKSHLGPPLAILCTMWFAGPWVYLPTVSSALWDFLCTAIFPSKTFWSVFLIFLIWYVNSLFEAYLDLGRGGTSPDIWGFWRVTRLKAMAQVNVLKPPRVPPATSPYRGRLFNLPQRMGPRPTVGGVAPQRQLNQRANPSTYYTLEYLLREYANLFPQHLVLENSFLEGHLPALKRRLQPNEVAGRLNTDAEFGGEIAHAHVNDGSVHVVLHPEDVRTVIEAGYGELHPLAQRRWYWQLYYRLRGIRFPVPQHLCFVYAPLHEGDYEVFQQILEAAIWWATRGAVYPVSARTYAVPPAPAPTQ